MKKQKTTQSEIDGVQYRRASGARIALAATSALSIACFASAIGYVSYAANLGFGISTILVGTLMTIARLFDGITDPLISVIIDRFHSRYGKIRIFMGAGWILEALSLMCLYNWFCGKVQSVFLFMVFYLLYYIGYTCQNMAGQLISPVITNDPKQRPLVGVWNTVYNYVIAIILSILVSMILLPRYGNTYTVELLKTISIVNVLLSFVFLMLSFIGVAPIDKPENFVVSEKSKGSLDWKSMFTILKDNKALQCFIWAATSDKLAMQIAGQSIVSTLLYGIMIGNMGLSALINMIAIFPALIFAVIGGRYTGKHGSTKGIVFWSRVSLILNALFIVIFLLSGSTPLIDNMPLMILFVVITMVTNGSKVAVSTATSAMQADIVDYEAYCSGRYMPGIVAGVYSLVDKVVSSFGAVLATMGVALIGYTDTVPQPSDPKTMPVVWMGIMLVYGVNIIGYICTLIAMKKTPISKEKMVEAQKAIGEMKKENGGEKGEGKKTGAGSGDNAPVGREESADME